MATATQPVRPMPRGVRPLLDHLTLIDLEDGHALPFLGASPRRDDLMWQHLESHIGPIANHRHEWGNEEVRPA